MLSDLFETSKLIAPMDAMGVAAVGSWSEMSKGFEASRCTGLGRQVSAPSDPIDAERAGPLASS